MEVGNVHLWGKLTAMYFRNRYMGETSALGQEHKGYRQHHFTRPEWLKEMYSSSIW